MTRKLRLDTDKTLKQLFDRFYLIPKDKEFSKEELQLLNKHSVAPTHEEVKNGKNGYIVFRNTNKKLTKEQAEIIKNDTGSVRAKAEKYKISIGTVSKIMNDKY